MANHELQQHVTTAQKLLNTGKAQSQHGKAEILLVLELHRKLKDICNEVVHIDWQTALEVEDCMALNGREVVSAKTEAMLTNIQSLLEGKTPESVPS